MKYGESMKDDGSPERALWVAMLNQLVEDAISPKYTTFAGEAASIREEAHKLLFEINETHEGGYTHWFETICEMAGVSPATVRGQAFKKLTEGQNVRKRT